MTTDTDPTRIHLDVDTNNEWTNPLIAHLRGTAIHGNAPFDMPFITKVDGNLWHGGCETGMVLPGEVKHVVSLYPWERYTVTHPLLTDASFRLYDSNDQPDRERIEAIATLVNDCRRDGVTLVHCQAGLNRSSLIVATALALQGEDIEVVIAHMRQVRSPAVLCNTTFEHYLLAAYGTD